MQQNSSSCKEVLSEPRKTALSMKWSLVAGGKMKHSCFHDLPLKSCLVEHTKALIQILLSPVLLA